MESVLHLARRLSVSLRSGGPAPADQVWAHAHLGGEERRLWQRHRPTDQRHTVAVARLLHREDPTTPDWVIAAALLHDIGKTTADLPVPGRVVASALKLIGVRRAPGVVGRYLHYPAAGADLLRRAGSDRRVVDWAAQHHQAPDAWTVPPAWGRRLRDADDRVV